MNLSVRPLAILNMDKETTKGTIELKRRHLYFAVLVVASVILTWRGLSALVLYSLRDESGSHIVLIPFISLFLVQMARKTIFVEGRRSIGLGGTLIGLGLVAYWQASRHSFAEDGSLFFSEAALAVVGMWIGAFVLCYGSRAARAALFPLLFLLLMVPLPEVILRPAVHFLQQGSTVISYFIFKAFGVPVLRQGFLLALPGVTIEVATECSGIRSSIALLITCLLAAHLSLRTPWKILLFVALVIPLSVVKNGIRIATLVFLSVYVDPGFLTGRLHREGGFVFFVLALAMLWPVLQLLQRSEGGRPHRANPAPTEQGATGTVGG